MSLFTIVTLLALGCVQGQFFEDRRCRCVCPNPASVLNTTITRQIYTANVPPSQCDCEHVVVPQFRAELEGKTYLICPRCDCRYETRNTTLIMAVVFLILVVIGAAFIFMLCFTWLNWLLFRGRNRQDFIGMHSERHLNRPTERDYIREHRGEFERARRARQLRVERELLALHNKSERERNASRNRPARDQSPDSEHELLDNEDSDN